MGENMKNETFQGNIEELQDSLGTRYDSPVNYLFGNNGGAFFYKTHSVIVFWENDQWQLKIYKTVEKESCGRCEKNIIKANMIECKTCHKDVCTDCMEEYSPSCRECWKIYGW